MAILAGAYLYRLTVLFSLALISIPTAQAGIQFFPSSDSAMLTLPEFKNTEEAERYGQSNRHNKQVIRSLYYTWKDNYKSCNEMIATSLKDKSVRVEALKLSLKNQLIHEALQEATKNNKYMNMRDLEAEDALGASIYAGSEPLPFGTRATKI